MSSSRTDLLVDVTMPQMGVSVVEGTLVAWRVGVGDRVEADQTICEISTDKIDTEVPAPVAGVVAELLIELESTVPVGTVLARVAVEGGAPADVVSAPPASAQPRSAAPVAAADNGSAGSDGRYYSPIVRRIAVAHGIDLSTVAGTGRGGRVRKQDVMAVVDGAGAAFAPAAEPPLHIESPYRPEPVRAVSPRPEVTPTRVLAPAPAGAAADDSAQLSRMRRTIGEHMKRSLETAATCTTWIEADMGRVEASRRRLGVTALAFVARACVGALREFPALNAWLQEDGTYTRFDREVHLGIAVSLGEDGLIVPVVRDAHELSEEGLAARVRELASRARAGGLTPDEVRGATFTITNPGQYGSIMATPIINQPQVAILDLEAIVKRPVVVTDPDGNDSIAIRPMTVLGLSWDHRALDGALAAQFLAAVKRRLETAA